MALEMPLSRWMTTWMQRQSGKSFFVVPLCFSPASYLESVSWALKSNFVRFVGVGKCCLIIVEASVPGQEPVDKAGVDFWVGWSEQCHDFCLGFEC